MLTNLLFLAALAFAHSEGHGAAISGAGPAGGRLAPVILAKDAEKGADAPTQGVAEWWKEGETIRIQLWDPAQQQKLAVRGEEVKWILLGKNLPKPIVEKSGTELKRAFSALPQTELVEVILPGLGESEEKFVVALVLSAPAPKGKTSKPQNK